MTNEEIVREACRVIWTEGDVSRVGEFYTEDFEADYPFTNWGAGLEGVAALAQTQREIMPDYREQIDELINADGKVIVILTIRGTHLGAMDGIPATGKEVEFRDVTICEIRDGRIAKQSGLSDLMTYFLQLGLVALPGARQAPSGTPAQQEISSDE